MNKTLRLLLAAILTLSTTLHAKAELFDMDEIKDVSTLKVEVIEDWHEVAGNTKTRQKVITINVGNMFPGEDFRIPVRFIVPADKKAKGFHLTGGHRAADFKKGQDKRVGGSDELLLKNGVGRVMTIVQEPGPQDNPALAKKMKDKFIKTLETRYSIQYWGWPAVLMRAITAAYAEKDYFEKGKIAMSGGSKNGASPTIVLINDTRTTAVLPSVSFVSKSPLRMCETEAWDKLRDQIPEKGFLGGNNGPSYVTSALAAGHKWEDLQRVAKNTAKHIFVSENQDQLKKRDVDMLFSPGSHDMVAYDMAHTGVTCSKLRIYLTPNSGHGAKNPLASAKKYNVGKTAFLMDHFFGSTEKLLSSPKVEHNAKGGKLKVKITFPDDEKPTGGDLWWMFDRAPDGTPRYIKEKFQAENHLKLKQTSLTVFEGEIPLRSGAAHIDFFATFMTTIEVLGEKHSGGVSSPYTRVKLK